MMNEKTKAYILDLLKTDMEVNPDLDWIKDMYQEVKDIPMIKKEGE